MISEEYISDCCQAGCYVYQTSNPKRVELICSACGSKALKDKK